MGLVGGHKRPSHRPGTAALDDADGQDRAAEAPGGGVERQGQLRPWPTTQHPAPQWHQTGFPSKSLTVGAPFGLGRVTALAHLLPYGLLLAAPPHGQEHGHGRQRTGAGQHHAQAPTG